MRKISFNIQISISRYLIALLLLLTCFNLQAQAASCNDLGETESDSYLDTFLYYASFNKSQNSFFRFTNPFQGQRLMQKGSVMFWARLPALSDDLNLQRGRFFDCGDSMTARLDNNFIRANLTANITTSTGAITQNLTRHQLDTNVFGNFTTPLLEWQSYVFTFKSGVFSIFLSGILLNQTLMYPYLNTNPSTCVVGNNLNSTDPFNGYMRHLIFSLEGHEANSLLTYRTRTIVLPDDYDVLAYFDFGREFNFQETYYYNSTRNYQASNVVISYASEPETVCYCTDANPPVMRLSKDFKIRPVDLSSLNLNVDSNGITFLFNMYAIKVENPDLDTVLFSLPNYMNLVLTNNSNTLRVSLFDSTQKVALNVSFPSYRFNFQHWRYYGIQILSNQIILVVDSELIESKSHSVILPTMSAKQFLIFPSSNIVANLQYLDLSKNMMEASDLLDEFSLSVYMEAIGQTWEPTFLLEQSPLNETKSGKRNLQGSDSIFITMLEVTFTKDELTIPPQTPAPFVVNQTFGYFNYTFYFDPSDSSKNTTVTINPDQATPFFFFDQRNDQCIWHEYADIVTLWDGTSCSTMHASPLFVNTTGTKSQLKGPVTSISPSGNMTVEFWFKPILDLYDDDSLQNVSTLFTNYLLNSSGQWQQLVKIYFTWYYTQDSDGDLEFNLDFVCDARFPTQNSTTIHNSNMFKDKTWMHYACAFSNSSGEVGQILYNAQISSTLKEDFSYSKFNGNLFPRINSTSQMMTYVSNSMNGNEPYLGLMRELRIHKNDIELDQLRVMRFQKISRIYMEQNLLHVFHMSSAYESLFFQSALTDINPTLASPRFQSQVEVVSNYLDGFAYTQEKDLLLCPADTLWTGSCCDTITNLVPIIIYNENVTSLDLYFHLNNDYVEAGAIYQWQLVRLLSTNTSVNNITQKNFADVQAALNRWNSLQLNQEISLPYSIIWTNSSYTFSVRIISPHLSYPLNQSAAIVLTCPRGRFFNQTKTIIHQWGMPGGFRLTTDIQNQCYPRNLNVSVTWAHDYLLGQPFTIANDSRSIIFNRDAIIPFSAEFNVQMIATFSNGVVLSDSKKIVYVPQAFEINFAYDQLYIEYGSFVFIDANESLTIMNSIPYEELQFNATCPAELMKNRSACQIDQDGYFFLHWADMNPPVPNKDYNFTISIVRVGTNFSISRNVTVSWFNPPPTKADFDKGQAVACPSVSVPMSIEVETRNMRNFSYWPKFFLACSNAGGVGYSLVDDDTDDSESLTDDDDSTDVDTDDDHDNSGRRLFHNDNLNDTQIMTILQNYNKNPYYEYSVVRLLYYLDTDRLDVLKNQTNQTLLFKFFTDVFELQNDGASFRVKPSLNQSIQSYFRPGDIIPIIIQLDTIDTLGSYTYIEKFDIKVLISSLVLDTTVSSQNVSYEDELVINASASFDPDQPMNNQTLNYTFLCNGTQCNVSNTSALQRGILRMSLLDRLRLGYQFNTDYNFSVTVTNPTIAKKIPQTRNFTIRFLPPNYSQVGCPRSFYFNRTGNFTNRLVNYTFTTNRVQDMTINLGIEYCTNVTNVTRPLNFVLLELPTNKSIFRENFTQPILQITNPNATSFNFTLNATRLLSQMKLNETVTISAITIYNYTVNNVTLIGYSVSQFNITRQYSDLQPVMTGFNRSSLVFMLGIEEAITIDRSQSFDPDFNYTSNDEKSQIQTRYVCSPSIQNVCNDFMSQPQLQISKRSRVLSNVNNLTNTFWVAIIMIAPGRKSAVANQTFLIVPQDASKCFRLNDRIFAYNFSEVEDIPRTATISPTISQFCEDANYAQINWTSGNTNRTFWSTQGQKANSIQISSDQLIPLPRNAQIPLNAMIRFTIPSSNLTFNTTMLNYTIVVQPPRPKANLNVTNPIILSKPNADVTAFLTRVNNTQSASCNFTCFIGNTTIGNCGGNSNKCSFNAIPVFKNTDQDLFSVDSSIFVAITFQNSVYNASRVLTFVDSDAAPLCEINIISNPNLIPTQPVTLAVNCSNFKPADLRYTWSIQNLSSDSFANGNDKQIIKISADGLKKLNGNPLTVQVNVSEKAAKNNTVVVKAIFTTKQMSVVEGQILANPSQGDAGVTPFNISIRGFQDTSGTPLSYQLKYFERSGQIRTIVTLTAVDTFVTLLPNINQLIVEIIDQLGNVQKRNVTLDIKSAKQFADLTAYTDYRRIIERQMVAIGPTSTLSVDISDYELGLNSLARFADVLNDNIQPLKMNLTTQISQKAFAFTYTVFFVRQINRFSLNQDSKANSLVQMADIFTSIYDDSLAQNISTQLDNFILNSTIQKGDEWSVLLKVKLAKLMNNLQNSNLTNQTALASLQSKLNAANRAVRAQLVSGEVLSVPSEQRVLKKISSNDVPETGVRVSNQNIQFQLPKDTLAGLNITDAVINMKVVEVSGNLSATSNGEQKFELKSDVIEINIEDLDGSEIKVNSSNAAILFDNVNSNNIKNLQCSYFDPNLNIWQTNSSVSGLTTNVTTDETGKTIVNCVTTHLSIFSVVEIQVTPSTNTPGGSGGSGNTGGGNGGIGIGIGNYTIPFSLEITDGRTAVYIIQAILIGLSLITFIIMTVRESTKVNEAVNIPFVHNVFEKMTYGTVIGAYSKFLAICIDRKLNILNRLLVFVNYLFYISIFILVNLTITINVEDIHIGDRVYMIGSCVVVFLFGAPVIKQWFIYFFVTFGGRSALNTIYDETQLQDNNSKKSFMAESATVDYKSGFDTVRANDSNSAPEKTPQPSDGQNDSEGWQLAVKTKDGLADATVDENGISGSVKIGGLSIQGAFQFEGGDKDNFGPQTKDSAMSQMNVSAQGPRTPMNQTKEKFTSHFGGEPAPIEIQIQSVPVTQVGKAAGDQNEMILFNQCPVFVIQFLLFLIGAAINAYLLNYIKVREDREQAFVYIASLLISIGILFVVLDFVIAGMAYCILQKGLKRLNSCDIAFSLTFIGLDRLRTYQ